MTKIVLADINRVDLDLSLTQLKVLDSVNELSVTKETTFILPITKENLKIIDNHEYEIYIPATYLTGKHEHTDHVSVYFDLENYAFFQAIKEIIQKEAKPKGVLRFRRMVKQREKISSLAGDLYVLSHLLGGALNIQVKQTSQSVIPAHTIVLANFGGGTMAHIEYTVSNQEQIEMEWSGVNDIIEFDSNEMHFIQSGDRTDLPFPYTIDSILETAHAVDKELIDELKKFELYLNGGGLK